MSINKLFAVLQCQRTTPNRLRGEARNGRRATYVRRSRRPDGDLRDKPGCVPASGCTKGAPWRISRCIGPDGSPVGGAQQRRLSPYLVSQEEKPSKSARGAGPPGTRKTRRASVSFFDSCCSSIPPFLAADFCNFCGNVQCFHSSKGNLAPRRGADPVAGFDDVIEFCVITAADGMDPFHFGRCIVCEAPEV